MDKDYLQKLSTEQLLKIKEANQRRVIELVVSVGREDKLIDSVLQYRQFSEKSV